MDEHGRATCAKWLMSQDTSDEVTMWWDPARRLAVAPAVPDARAQRSTCTTSASCSEICVIQHTERTLVLAGGPAAARRRPRGEPRACDPTSGALRLPRGAHGPATDSWGSHDTCLPEE